MSMGNQHPDVTDEEIGMRAFQIRKARAVERAQERMRQGLKVQWSALTMSEIETLGWLLGELWAYVARADWEDLHFGLLSLDEVREVIAKAREITDHERNTVDALQEVYALVKAKG